jgi:hypothetical protein
VNTPKEEYATKGERGGEEEGEWRGKREDGGNRIERDGNERGETYFGSTPINIISFKNGISLI